MKGENAFQIPAARLRRCTVVRTRDRRDDEKNRSIGGRGVGLGAGTRGDVGQAQVSVVSGHRSV